MSNVSSVKAGWWGSVSSYQWFVFAMVSGAWLFDTLDQRLFSLARIIALAHLMGSSGSDLAVQSMAKTATAVFLFGWGIGGLTIGGLGDRFGRVKLLLISVSIYSACSALTALTRSADAFIILRFFTGIGIGGVFGLAVAILSDTVSGRTRIAMLALLQVLSTVGNILAAAIKMGVDSLVAHGTLGPDDGWRVLFFIGALPILIVLVAIGRLREPEPWQRLKDEGNLPRGMLGAYIEIFQSQIERRHLIIGTALSISGIVGLWAIGEFAVDFQDALFTAHFLANNSPEVARNLTASAKNWAYVLQMLGGAAGMIVFGICAERFGRKPTFIVFFLSAAVVTVLAYWRMHTPFDAYWMMPLMGATQLGLLAGFSIYLPELFNSRVRGAGVSFSYNLGRFAAAGGGFLSALLTAEVFGGYPPLEALRYAAMTMCVIFLLGVVAAWVAPETRGADSGH